MWQVFTWGIVGILILAVIIYLGFSYYFARMLAFPKTVTLDQERQYEEDKQMWLDFDQLPRESYQVRGWKGYPLKVERILADQPSNRYVIISHGYTSNRLGAAKYVPVYRALGYHCIIYDARGHGENPVTAVSLGYLEGKDLLAIIEDCYKRYGASIELGLHGESMGSATSLSVLAYQPKLDFVVADCGFADLRQLILEAYGRYYSKIFLPGISLVTWLLYGFRLGDTRPIKAMADNQCPILFIHGSRDTLILPHHSIAMADRTPAYTRYQEVPNAVHAGSRLILGLPAYQAIIADFLQSIGK